MQVLKFGGTSVAHADTMARVVAIVQQAAASDKTILVASAIAGATDSLIEAGRLAGMGDKRYLDIINNLENSHLAIIEELIPKDYRPEIAREIAALAEQLRSVCKGVYLIKEVSHCSNDLIMSFGELFSTRILYTRFASLGLNCKWVDARTLIQTRLVQSRHVVNTEITYRNIRSMVQANHTQIFVVPGFIASDVDGRTATLGRGGSDYTASLMAVGSQARRLEIWTDVSGMMTADPRVVPQARTISHISYKEALELSHFGAKVVYAPTIQPVVSQGIPIVVKNTFDPSDPGTMIESNPPAVPHKIKGISSSDSIALLSMEGSGMVGIPGYSSRLFEALTNNQINIILITQASSVYTMLVAIEEKDAEKARRAADEAFAYEISLHKVEPLRVECGFSIVSLIGDDMKNQSGASGRMFEAMGRRGVNIRAIAQGSSERNVSAVVETRQVVDALRAIHEEFFGMVSRRINLFIAGYGNVGRALMSMIYRERDRIFETKGIEINVAGVANSRWCIVQEEGLTHEAIPQALLSPTQASGARPSALFLEAIRQLHLQNSVFVDCTTDKFLATRYTELMASKVHVIVCNKIANSLSMDYYRRLRETARRECVAFMYHTNVGAALPVISLLQQMVQSGDEIMQVEASLSGTLNYVFAQYDASVPMETIVNQAQVLGYTEPDPMTDLSGADVRRKALIVAREIGYELEDEDIEFSSFLSDTWPDEPHFSRLYQEAAAVGRRLRYIATVKQGHVSVALQAVPESHPFYALSGTDSALLVISRMYPKGLLLKGAGAGAEQTASGLFANILQII